MQNFGIALEALKQGKRVMRSVWDGTDKKFIFRQVPSVIGKHVVPNMQSLPDSVKNYFQFTFDTVSEQISAIYYSDQVALVKASNLVAASSLSWEDLLATDWVILD